MQHKKQKERWQENVGRDWKKKAENWQKFEKK